MSMCCLAEVNGLKSKVGYQKAVGVRHEAFSRSCAQTLCPQ
jgi:hypothetical protein